MYFSRNLSDELKQAFSYYPVVTVIGPRQSGKSTLVKNLFPTLPYLNLESPSQLAIIKADPVGFINQYQNGAIIDEVQNYPELLSYIQVHVDQQNKNGIFVLTGSHQLALHEAISQSLAGRTAVLQLLPLSISELQSNIKKLSVNDLLLKGFYPRVYSTKIPINRFYDDYLKTYLERDVRKLINLKDIMLFQNFLKLCASLTGQVINQQNMAKHIGVSSTTISNWLSILESSFVIMRLAPYFENLGKRIIKSCKLYFIDVGLASYLNGIESTKELEKSIIKGALVENLVVMEMFKYRYNLGKPANLYFFRDSHQNEVDIIYKKADKLIPIEIKSSQTFDARFLKGLKYFKALASQRVETGYLLYQGDIEQKIKEFNLLNILHLEKIFTQN